MKLNKDWHMTHRMPKNATFEEKIEWHIEHQKHCNCRKPTGKIAEELRKRGLSAEP